MKNLLFILLFISISTTSYAQLWQGTYNSDFGELRLIQIGEKVYGDYKHVGSIEGTMSGNTLKGTFTNGSKKGRFVWTHTGKGFNGKWAWGTSTPSGAWNAKIKNSKAPTLTSSSKNKLPNLQGTWQSDFGELRLHQNGNKITGDYRNLGVIDAKIIADKVTGTFTNGKKNGRFEWTINGKSFVGKWAWGNAKLGGSWGAKLKSSAKPKLINNSKREGRYRVTITNLYTSTRDHHALGIFDETSEMYGMIGIRMKGKGQSGNVTLNAMAGKQPRVWDVSSGNPTDISQKGRSITIKDATGQSFKAAGVLEIDKMREFAIKGELANDKLMVNIQTNLAESNTTSDDKFGWKQRNLFVNDMLLSTEYLLIMNKGDDKVAVGFMIEKI